MTVKELIAELQEHDPEMPVLVNTGDNDSYITPVLSVWEMKRLSGAFYIARMNSPENT